MDNNKEVKKSTYFPESQKRYGEKRKTIGCTIRKEFFEEIEKHYKIKGYESVSGYILDLIKKDMKK